MGSPFRYDEGRCCSGIRDLSAVALAKEEAVSLRVAGFGHCGRNGFPIPLQCGGVCLCSGIRDAVSMRGLLIE